jgi:hypothetical protein
MPPERDWTDGSASDDAPIRNRREPFANAHRNTRQAERDPNLRRHGAGRHVRRISARQKRRANKTRQDGEKDESANDTSRVEPAAEGVEDDDAWYEKIDKLLNHIDGDLRLSRNRFVHVYWTAPNGQTQRRTRVAKVVKPQAFIRELVTEHEVRVRVKDVWDAGRAIIKAQISLRASYRIRRNAILCGFSGP